ncbi:MAG: gliding motility-associated C-terminal domain-containing protein, partial [Saprospiraceae bacterium]|nr:gliding motility-associated C-terminal domain-containing protein [Saprospiraceae bacterium]
SLADRATTRYVDDSQSGTRFYYLVYRHDCPGEPSISSDTLDNRSPVVTKIQRVTVVNETVRIDWEPNGSPETIGYIIYRSTDVGTIPIDTVFNALTYTDTEAQPHEQIEFYYVLALDACGNTSVFDDSPHGTIFLQTEVDFCAQHIRLEWNPYIGWLSDIENHQIWLGIDGAPIEFLHQVSGQDTMAYITGVITDQQHCIRIRGKQSGTDVESFSNTVCLTPDVLSALNEFRIDNVTIDGSGQVAVDWTFNTIADLAQLSMQRSQESDLWNELSPNYQMPPSQNSNTYMDEAANIQLQPYFYRLHSTDVCDSSFISNTFSTIFLEIESKDGGVNNLNWTPLAISDRSVVDYEICRIDASGLATSVQVGTSELSYIDEIDLGSGIVETCYMIKGRHVHPVSGDTLVSHSNLVCTEQEIAMYVPNAFVPGGINSIFKPEIVVPGAISEYSLSIFNKWGGQVFESTNPDHGWDGYVNGSLLAPDVYIYAIEIEQTGGKTSRRSGTVNLIR